MPGDLEQLPVFLLDVIGVSNIRRQIKGIHESDVYLVNIYLPNHVVFEQVHVTCGKLNGPFSILIGMDIISTGDFAITHPNGKTKMTFSFPSSRNIDFVKEFKRDSIMGGRRKLGKRR